MSQPERFGGMATLALLAGCEPVLAVKREVEELGAEENGKVTNTPWRVANLSFGPSPGSEP
jgi:hypothetical protein